MPSQKSLHEQLRDTIQLCVGKGLYDAADFIQRLVDTTDETLRKLAEHHANPTEPAVLLGVMHVIEANRNTAGASGEEPE